MYSQPRIQGSVKKKKLIKRQQCFSVLGWITCNWELRLLAKLLKIAHFPERHHMLCLLNMVFFCCGQNQVLLQSVTATI